MIGMADTRISIPLFPGCSAAAVLPAHLAAIDKPVA
jgi:hypothetical protein